MGHSFRVLERKLLGEVPVGKTAAPVAAAVFATAMCVACGDSEPAEAEPTGLSCKAPPRTPPACGSGAGDRSALLAGPGEAGHDAALAAQATLLERQFHGFNAFGVHVSAEVSLSSAETAKRALVTDFLAAPGEWDFEAFSGQAVPSVIERFHKVAGAYGGVSIAADAYRYGTLRDQGADCAEVEQARAFVVADLDALHLASAITGVPGVVARGFARADLPGAGQDVTPTPLFDADGAPLPAVKDNGTWRADNSGGLYPEYVWEDSCSRDMLAGWAFGYAALWEVIRDDDTIPKDLKSRLRADATAIGRSLMQVGEEGYDLEIRDADGRRTFHGILHENSIDRVYFPAVHNAFNALLALGIVSALTYVSEEPDLIRYLEEELLAKRKLDLMARDEMDLLDVGVKTNFSGYNMAFGGGYMASRYLCNERARDVVSDAVVVTLYDPPGKTRQPVEQKQSLYDIVAVAAGSRQNAWQGPSASIDESALDRALQSLREFPKPPYWDRARVNCDDAEIASGKCIAEDGTPLTLLGYVGRGDELVSEEPVPMRVRPYSNYHWRSNPYAVNGEGSGDVLLPGSDFRVAYWTARWLSR